MTRLDSEPKDNNNLIELPKSQNIRERRNLLSLATHFFINNDGEVIYYTESHNINNIERITNKLYIY